MSWRRGRDSLRSREHSLGQYNPSVARTLHVSQPASNPPSSHHRRDVRVKRPLGSRLPVASPPPPAPAPAQPERDDLLALFDDLGPLDADSVFEFGDDEDEDGSGIFGLDLGFSTARSNDSFVFGIEHHDDRQDLEIPTTPPASDSDDGIDFVDSSGAVISSASTSSLTISSSETFDITKHAAYLELEEEKNELQLELDSARRTSTLLKSQLTKLKQERNSATRSLREVRGAGFTLDELDRLRRQKRLLKKEKRDRDERIKQLVAELEQRPSYSSIPPTTPPVLTRGPSEEDLARMRSLEGQLNTLETELTQSRADLQKKTVQLEELEQSTSVTGTASEQASLALRKKIKQLEEALATSKTRLTSVKVSAQTQLQAFKKQLSAAVSEKLQATKAAYEKIKTEKEQIETQLASVSQERNEAVESLNSAVVKLESLEEESQEKNISAESDLESLRTESSQTISSLEELVEDLKNELVNQKSRLEDSEQLALETLREKSENEILNVKRRYEARIAALKTSHSEDIEGIRSEASEASEEIKSLQQQLQESMEKTNLEKQRFDALKNKANKMIAAARAQTQQLTTKVQQRDAALATLKQRLAKSVSSIRSGVSDVRERIRVVRHDYNGLADEVRGQLQTLPGIVDTIKTQIAGRLLHQLTVANKKYIEESNERRRIFNELQDLKGKIRVYVRIRPLLAMDRSQNICIQAVPELPQLRIQTASSGVQEYEFDRVFGPDSTQEGIFGDVAPLSTSVLDGYNVCICAYGQTGSGKTFTMEGPQPISSDEVQGVNFRAVTRVFEVIEERLDVWDYEVSVSIVEIYIDRVFDLLAGTQPVERELRLAGEYVEVVDGVAVVVNSLEDLLEQLNCAKQIRATAATRSNEHSSRSHCIVSLQCIGVNRVNGVEMFGKLHLVDLAGSESMKKTQLTDPRRVAEANAINVSLSALGNVMLALARKQKFVPFRDSSLTKYLSDSLGGQSKVMMFCCLNPAAESAFESGRSLQFAKGIKRVVLGPAKRNIRHSRQAH